MVPSCALPFCQFQLQYHAKKLRLLNSRFTSERFRVPIPSMTHKRVFKRMMLRQKQKRALKSATEATLQSARSK